MNGDIAQAVATTPAQHRTQVVNATLSLLDEQLRIERTYVVPGAAGASLWALREVLRIATERLQRIGVWA